MSKTNRKTWMIYGGVIGVIAFLLLAVAMLAWKKYFTLQSADTPWNIIFPLTFIAVLPGAMIGAYIGYEVAPKSKQERIEFFKEGIFFLFVVGICHYILNRMWQKPEAEERFWLAVAWDLGPLLFAASLWKLVLRKKIS